jgi:hypothetical protein
MKSGMSNILQVQIFFYIPQYPTDANILHCTFQKQIFYRYQYLTVLFSLQHAHLAEERIKDERCDDEVCREVGAEDPEHHLLL